MFGYIKYDYKQLSEADRFTYRQFYYGLCQELNKSAGLKGQLLLNHDSCFLAILLQSLYNPECQVDETRCLYHPFSNTHSYSSEAIRYAADMDVILSYHSLMDDYKDGDSKISGLFASLLKKDYLKIKDRYPRQVKAVEDYIVKLSEAERTKETNIDIVSSFTGEMLGELFNWKDDAWSKTLYCMGYYMGKFIYIIDAYEDLKKDNKARSYNPLIFLKHETPRDYETFVRVNLTSLMSECTKSFERLPIVSNENILRSIIYSGVWIKYESLQTKEKKRVLTPRQITN
ncbi:MAG: DUF5685 family protein [Pseudobutyrivibrio sp.]|nr:DUF5685 family protein [Pseudobutyrivibrio sp.]